VVVVVTVVVVVVRVVVVVSAAVLVVFLRVCLAVSPIKRLHGVSWHRSVVRRRSFQWGRHRLVHAEALLRIPSEQHQSVP